MTESQPPPATAPKLAPHHVRLFALVLDYLLIVILLKLADQLLLGAHWDLRPVSAGVAVVTPAWAAGLVALLLAKDGLSGRSPGKWFGGIAVVLAHNPSTAAPLHKSLLRNLTLPLLPLECVLVFLDPYWRRLGDRLAGTVVVTPGSAPPLRVRVMGMAVMFLAVLLASFLVTTWNLRRSAAYEKGYQVASFDGAVIAAVGGPVEVDSSPTLELSLEPGGGSAVLTFQAEGPRGSTEVRVALRLGAAPRRWDLEQVTVSTAKQEPLIKQAPPR